MKPLCSSETWQDRPVLRGFIKAPAAKDPPPEASRARLLIYIYDLPAIYNSCMLQYRAGTWSSMWLF